VRFPGFDLIRELIQGFVRCKPHDGSWRLREGPKRAGDVESVNMPLEQRSAYGRPSQYRALALESPPGADGVAGMRGAVRLVSRSSRKPPRFRMRLVRTAVQVAILALAPGPAALAESGDGGAQQAGGAFMISYHPPQPPRASVRAGRQFPARPAVSDERPPPCSRGLATHDVS